MKSACNTVLNAKRLDATKPMSYWARMASTRLLLGEANKVVAHQFHKDYWTLWLNSVKSIEEIIIVI